MKNMYFDMGITFDADITHCYFGTIEDFLAKYSLKYDLRSSNQVLYNTIGVYVAGWTSLCSLGCTVLTKEGQGIELVPFDQTPEYKYLNGDKDSYTHYYKDIVKNFDRHNPDIFNKLVQALDQGYDDTHVVGVEPNGSMFDGKHRTAYLYKKYGCEHKVRFLCPIFTAKNTGAL